MPQSYHRLSPDERKAAQREVVLRMRAAQAPRDNRIVALSRAKTVPEIAAETGVAEVTVRKVLKRSGLYRDGRRKETRKRLAEGLPWL